MPVETVAICASSSEAASSLGSLSKEAAMAAVRGDEAALLAWLDSGGRVNATGRTGDANGITVLMYAAQQGHHLVWEKE